MGRAELRAEIRALAQEYLREPHDEFPGAVWHTVWMWVIDSGISRSDRSQMLDAWARYASWDDELDAVFLGDLDADERLRIHRELHVAAQEILADEE